MLVDKTAACAYNEFSLTDVSGSQFLQEVQNLLKELVKSSNRMKRLMNQFHLIVQKQVPFPKVELSREYDEEFDRYIMSEGHNNKMDVLKAVDILVKQDLLDEDCRNKTIEFIIATDRIDSDAQRIRLEKYCKYLMGSYKD